MHCLTTTTLGELGETSPHNLQDWKNCSNRRNEEEIAWPHKPPSVILAGKPQASRSAQRTEGRYSLSDLKGEHGTLIIEGSRWADNVEKTTYADVSDEASVGRALEGCDAAVNAVGALRRTGR